MICEYCFKDTKDIKGDYSKLREIIKFKGITSSCYIKELFRVSKTLFPERPAIMDVCIDCECAIAEDSDKFILKQRLLR